MRHSLNLCPFGDFLKCLQFLCCQRQDDTVFHTRGMAAQNLLLLKPFRVRGTAHVLTDADQNKTKNVLLTQRWNCVHSPVPCSVSCWLPSLSPSQPPATAHTTIEVTTRGHPAEHIKLTCQCVGSMVQW